MILYVLKANVLINLKITNLGRCVFFLLLSVLVMSDCFCSLSSPYLTFIYFKKTTPFLETLVLKKVVMQLYIYKDKIHEVCRKYFPLMFAIHRKSEEWGRGVDRTNSNELKWYIKILQHVMKNYKCKMVWMDIFIYYKSAIAKIWKHCINGTPFLIYPFKQRVHIFYNYRIY